MKTLKDFEFKGKLVFLRVDFNVPIKDGIISDDTRIKASLPTINYLLENNAKLVLASHLGRPKGKIVAEMSLGPVAKRLSELLNKEVLFNGLTIGDDVEAVKEDLNEGQIYLLENLRFDKCETDNDEGFSKELAKGIDIFISDAFGTVHRAHASVAGITKFVENKGCGLLIKKEMDYLGKILENPERPFCAILGGAKVSDKITVIENLLNIADVICIGGAMSYTFLKAQGVEVGNSLVEDDKLELTKIIMKKAADLNKRIVLPLDHVISKSIKDTTEIIKTEGTCIEKDFMGLDIGEKTVELYKDIINNSATVFWNGPVGVFENEAFANGTLSIAKALAASNAISVIGGGDSVSAINKAGVQDRMNHISTGGGASMEFIEGKKLPGIEALKE
ncbi:MAG: phosphoglycerate kinase [Pseudomonadota bacterium]